MLLQLQNISKTYQDGSSSVQAVDGVSMQLDAGEFVAVQGPSGCGKSTLLLTAGGLLKPTSGTVTIDGQDPYSMTADERANFRARTIGFVFQQFHLVPYLSVYENILAPGMAVKTKANPERAQQLIERFGLTDRQHHVPAKLSSGERQRVAMARSLLNEPELILADEPTGNLDHENAEILLQFLAEFASEGGGVLLVTHDDRAVSHAQKAIHILDGKLTSPATAMNPV
ncbi:ABC transporter ATP-binding protein [Thalassoglobus polymorphus]|uniref:Lipoprotein-releasing system ATP-binding protein LolD n=1 Tax=Thalassoglobus polymorphus TaxID=2527994 RepID=A0A517QN57_9PLAN|nr:ABC transporter ATP-binding protein [Thalassoglobus polymorphus]QDT33069.1 Lipoprotein-releasing system ATP-binding protein LolD [Thalassoglobus polymorphus]